MVGHSSARARALAGAALLAAVLVGTGSTAASAAGCDATATPPSLSGAVAGASAGQTICLAAGNYGTWQGTGKAITLKATPGTATMKVNLGPGDTGFTLDGLSGMGGTVNGGAHDFTVRNSSFTSPIDIDATNAGIVLDHNSHNWNAVYDGSANAKIFVWNDSGSFSGVTVENSTISNGNLDGIHLGGGAGIDVLHNEFANLCDTGTNHTDNIQFEGGRGGRIAGNYVHESPGCDTQGITSFDGGTVGVVIEDNVVDIRRPWGIELYADRNSVVRHNTVRWYAPSACNFHIDCGQIDIDRKSQDPAGTGTQVYDNLATVDFANGSTGTEHHNVSAERARFAGPLSSYVGFRLASDSPVGLGAAHDGTNAGARVTALPAPLAPTNQSPRPSGGGTQSRKSPKLPRLVASFGFGERSGARVLDGSGLGNDGRIRGAHRIRGGKHGRALYFDGDRDYVSVPDSRSLDLSRGMTLEAWVRPTGSRRSWGSAILKERPGGLAYALYAPDNHGRASGFVHVSAEKGSPSHRRLRLRRWSHVAATYDGSALKTYVNGVLVSSRLMRGGIGGGSGPLKIGGNGVWGEWFKGAIDDVRVWRTALSRSAIRADMRAAAAAPRPPRRK
jgi:Concanavalin A-like lectin/glucanases superfamily/Right handed beta helix region